MYTFTQARAELMDLVDTVVVATQGAIDGAKQGYAQATEAIKEEAERKATVLKQEGKLIAVMMLLDVLILIPVAYMYTVPLAITMFISGFITTLIIM